MTSEAETNTSDAGGGQRIGDAVKVLLYLRSSLFRLKAVAPERQLKTGFGRAYLKRRLGLPEGGPPIFDIGNGKADRVMR
jgi:hypothetical protein